MTKTLLAEPERAPCIVAGCLATPPRDTLICQTHAAQLKPVTASAPPACGCLPGQPCAQHDQVGQGRGPRRTRRGRT